MRFTGIRLGDHSLRNLRLAARGEPISETALGLLKVLRLIDREGKLTRVGEAVLARREKPRRRKIPV
jgi:hypothetical protein